MKADIHIVLIEPEIPQNTGNIGRTCVGIGAELHLVGKLGFSLADKDLKRAGLDYWPKLKVTLHKDWDEFLRQVPSEDKLCFFSTHGTVPLWKKKFTRGCYLVFGSESKGFPRFFYEKYKDSLIRIPVSGDIRSLNLSVSAGVAAFEALRQMTA